MRVGAAACGGRGSHARIVVAITVIVLIVSIVTALAAVRGDARFDAGLRLTVVLASASALPLRRHECAAADATAGSSCCSSVVGSITAAGMLRVGRMEGEGVVNDRRDERVQTARCGSSGSRGRSGCFGCGRSPPIGGWGHWRRGPVVARCRRRCRCRSRVHWSGRRGCGLLTEVENRLLHSYQFSHVRLSSELQRQVGHASYERVLDDGAPAVLAAAGGAEQPLSQRGVALRLPLRLLARALLAQLMLHARFAVEVIARQRHRANGHAQTDAALHVAEEVGQRIGGGSGSGSGGCGCRGCGS